MTHDDEIRIQSYKACLGEVRRQIRITPNDMVRPLYDAAKSIEEMINQIYERMGVTVDAE